MVEQIPWAAGMGRLALCKGEGEGKGTGRLGLEPLTLSSPFVQVERRESLSGSFEIEALLDYPSA